MKEQSGFNPAVARLEPPPVPYVQAWAACYGGDFGPVIDLSQAVPGYPPAASLLARLGANAACPAFAGYGAIEGEAGLRRAYANHLTALYGATIEGDEIQITAGCNQAFFVAALTVAEAGSRVVMTNPGYFNHEATLEMLGIEVRQVECLAGDNFLPRPAAVAAAIDDGVRAVCLTTPNNPTGAVYPSTLLRAIFEICRERGIWLILDETYRDFLDRRDLAPHDLFHLTGWRESVMQLYSFSKSFCIPGHRLGAIVAGRTAIGQIAKVMDNLQICAPRAAQDALGANLPELDEWREANRREIMARGDAFRRAIAAAPGWEIAALGAYFSYVRHPFAAEAAASVADRLATSCGVLTIPGSFFGRDQERYLRLAFANADSTEIGELATRLRQAGDRG